MARISEKISGSEACRTPQNTPQNGLQTALQNAEREKEGEKTRNGRKEGRGWWSQRDWEDIVDGEVVLAEYWEEIDAQERGKEKEEERKKEMGMEKEEWETKEWRKVRKK